MEIYHDDYEPIPNINRFEILSTLGEGTFGEVKKAYDTYTHRIVAIKYVRLLSKKNGLPKAIFREIESLKQLSENIFIVKLDLVFAMETSIAIVMEYIENDLQTLIHSSHRRIPQDQLQYFYYMMLSSISYCHANHIIHRDIKPSNFLLTSYGTIKLADFGLARIYHSEWNAQEKLSHQVSTRQYRAPELLFASRNYNEKIDIWSTVIVMIELILLKTFFPSTNDIDQMSKVFQVIGSPTAERWPEVEHLPDYGKVCFPDFEPIPLSILLPMGHPEDIQFLESFFQLNPAHRLSAKEGLELPYFQPINARVARLTSADSTSSSEATTRLASSFYLDSLYLTSSYTRAESRQWSLREAAASKQKAKKEKVITTVEELLQLNPFQS